MRITQNTIYNSAIRQVQLATQRLMEKQEIVSTQKQINRVSDDPVSALRVLDLDHLIGQVEQFERNIDRVGSLLDIYDTTLNQVTEILTQAKELVLGEASNAQSTTDTREAAAVELISLLQEMVQLANYKFDGRYIFAGTLDNLPAFTGIDAAITPDAGNTSDATATVTVSNPVDMNMGDTYEIIFTAPATFDVMNTATGATVLTGETYVSGDSISFDGLQVVIEDGTLAPAAGDLFQIQVAVPGVYLGNSQAQQVEIESDNFVPMNFTGDAVFQGAGLSGGEDIFALLNEAVEALRDGDVIAIDALLDRFDQGISQSGTFLATVGTRQGAVDSASSRLTNVKLGFKTLKSDLEDADITDAIVEYNQAQLAYEASLQAAGESMQISLLDFLR
ncbi:flagellar hook-associated protein FlgL [Candidatus Sumerlaeota bacterium]|nr:flagellar hook-associated protein FlgL [Candidatus Sumerlaeota bacterium]